MNQWDDDRRADQLELRKLDIADFKRREELRQRRLETALSAARESTVQRTPEEIAELQARLERLQRAQEGDPLPEQMPVVDLNE